MSTSKLITDAIGIMRALTRSEVAEVLRHVPGVRATTLPSGTCRMTLKVEPPADKQRTRRRRRPAGDGIPDDCRL